MGGEGGGGGKGQVIGIKGSKLSLGLGDLSVSP